MKKRTLCKTDLQRAVGLKKSPETPLLGFIGRLDHQKGIDTLIDAAPALFAQGAQLLVLGVGHPEYAAALTALQRNYPRQMRFETQFAEPLAHKIYGGVDLFLMPSRYEPCGLGQMIAMRYGALPVVSPTGGLLDTVADADASLKGTGFVAEDRSLSGFLKAVNRGLGVLRQTPARGRLQKRAMGTDHSWDRSVGSYLDLYESARRWHRE